jgi:hypothetical protein
MRVFLAWLALFILLVILFQPVIRLLKMHSPKETIQVTYKGDECPGICADSLHPANCKAYWDGHQVVIYNP